VSLIVATWLGDVSGSAHPRCVRIPAEAVPAFLAGVGQAAMPPAAGGFAARREGETVAVEE
jgi:hypothetical protein